MTTALMALSAIDGRYDRTAQKLRPHLSEFGLIKARLTMQVAYLEALCDQDLKGLRQLTPKESAQLASIPQGLTEAEAQIIADIETKGHGSIKATRHDVVAALTWLRQQLAKCTMSDLQGWVHFGLTSEDCNNIAYAIMLRDAIREPVLGAMRRVVEKLEEMAHRYAGLAMLGRTHGQPATPTTLGKEFRIFAERLTRQIHQIEAYRILVKLNGASGNYCAHRAAYPGVNWPKFASEFVDRLNEQGGGGPLRFAFNAHTTQIEPHDTYAELFGMIMRFNTILVDCAQDAWRYISDDYLTQPAVAGEVGSSAMPHKVNPIDFENAEGNLLFANAMLEFFSRKLPISRLQRDLSDSTVERNFGLALGHCLKGYETALVGLGKVSANEKWITEDLEAHPEILSEAIQTILRREGIPDAYNALKDITRGAEITEQDLAKFVASDAVPPHVKPELVKLTPTAYIGFAKELAT